MRLTNKVYDLLKFVGLLFIPALIVFINTLAEIWEWGETASKVSLSIAAFAILLGVVIQWTSSRYNKGEVDGGYLEMTGRDEDTGIPNLKLTVNQNPDDLVKARHVKLRVGPAPAPPVVEELEGE